MIKAKPIKKRQPIHVWKDALQMLISKESGEMINGDACQD
jgi:hypothetical protein